MGDRRDGGSQVGERHRDLPGCDARVDVGGMVRLARLELPLTLTLTLALTLTLPNHNHNHNQVTGAVAAAFHPPPLASGCCGRARRRRCS